MKKLWQRIKCWFGYHAEPIGACDVLRYEFGSHGQSRMLRYRTYWMCNACRREIAGK